MLKVNNLDAGYGSTLVLRGVSVDVNEGEIVTLIGANGAGKTTFLMTLSGIIKSTSGTIEFLETRIETTPPHEIVSMGLVQVPQSKLLFPEMTVLEHLELGWYHARYTRSKPVEQKFWELGKYQAGYTKSQTMEQKLRDIYDLFEVLGNRKNQTAGTLSGGEQQMLAIARALMTYPKLLLLDEPSSGLSPVMVGHLAEIINNLRNTGLTILLVEQNAYLALELADRGYVLESGNIVVSGNASILTESELVKKAYLGA